jgi:hypothetical protein
MPLHSPGAGAQAPGRFIADAPIYQRIESAVSQGGRLKNPGNSRVLQPASSISNNQRQGRRKKGKKKKEGSDGTSD